jgi:ankyrin repeat protein
MDDYKNTDKNMVTTLMQSIKDGHTRMAKYLLKEEITGNEDIDRNDKAKQTSLMYACGFGNFTMVRLLLKAGANINHVADEGGGPLVAALASNRYFIILYLIIKGAKFVLNSWAIKKVKEEKIDKGNVWVLKLIKSLENKWELA